MNFKDVSIVEDVIEYLNHVSSKTLVIYSITSVKVNSISLTNPNCFYISSKDMTKDINVIQKKLEEIPNFSEIITIGGGTATDIGKYIASLKNVKITSIITMLSTNVYATDKVALIVNGRKETLLAKMPDVIVVDSKILKNATKLNLYGLADVFSIYTALKDWDIAIEDGKDKIDIKIYHDAYNLLSKTISFVKDNSFDEICNHQEELFYLIGEAGYITNEYGCGRPESGSEHLFAKEIESLKEMPHAIAVSNGIILMSLLQDNFSEDILFCLNKLRLYEEAYQMGVRFDLIQKAYYQVIPRKDRYTIVDRVYQDEEAKQDVFQSFVQIMGGYYHVNN